MTASGSAYVLITPARNEAAGIEHTLRSVLDQAVRPERWVIVSDGSTDGTDEIIASYAQKHSFITAVRREAGAGRDFRSKVAAFRLGCVHLGTEDYGFIGNLDADVSVPEDYFARLLEEFQRDPRLGVAGGLVLEQVGDRFVPMRMASSSVAGAVQLFRRECWESTGGFVPLRNGGEDAAAEIAARSMGWTVRTFRDLEVRHHGRVVSGSSSVALAKFRRGLANYQLGYDPLFQAAFVAYRLGERPRVVGAVLTMAGYVWGAVRRLPRPISPAVRTYLREEQRTRFRAALGAGRQHRFSIR